ncbi:MAG: prepilin-type N-terminal cleavage/methylation domain-containing protein [Phycisphaerae bacterium]|nr:prepilin-type N-terminal cleavage/methylation domain-containing protein [Phycisphaerae bacterium]MDD5381632.1 prepilin-type N-terminal cleavage/methylation domain-containing protein [Phycisphaerae bacterium]
MNYKLSNSGFSLTEVLIAVGILAVGMVFVAGVFPAGIYLTTIATERTIAAVAADEAFAKIRIYAVGDLLDATDNVDITTLPTNSLTDFNDSTIFHATSGITADEFQYPSVDTNEPNQYCWSALCRRVAPDPNQLVQVIVFVSRKTGGNLKYPDPSDPLNSMIYIDWPRPVMVGVTGTAGGNELTIDSGYETFINDGYTVVDDATGRIYRVLERYKPPDDDTILLDMNWDGTSGAGFVWVVPPPVGGGRRPCITVYQKLIIF